jgi:hypothetical protein
MCVVVHAESNLDSTEKFQRLSQIDPIGSQWPYDKSKSVSKVFATFGEVLDTEPLPISQLCWTERIPTVSRRATGRLILPALHEIK